MTMTLDTNKNMYQFVSDDAEILSLEKASKRPTEVSDISKALDEYKRLFKAGISSPAELITLVRAFPNEGAFTKAAKQQGMFDDDFEPMVVGGPASVELVDREGHLITTQALSKAFDLYMKNFRTRNAMVLHSDVQVGWALPAYISKAGNIYKSGVDPEGLFFITELRDDTRIAKRVMEQIKEGKLKSYSIAGSATKTQNIQKGMESYMQVDDMELAEVTVCEKGVNQGANFDILKSGSGKPTSSCIDGSCLVKSGHTHNPTTVMVKADGNVDFLASLVNLVKDDNPFTNTPGKGDTPILGDDEAYRRREQVHHQLLDEQGFPAEVEPEQNRYIPTAEIELDENSNPINVKPPWVVNEAGQDLGASYAHEALSPPSAKEIHDKPYNLQKTANTTRKPTAREQKVFDAASSKLKKFVGLSGQRKKALIIEGHDSATDAFLSKDHIQYSMDKDQRQAPVTALSRRKDVTSGQVQLLPLLIDLVRATTAKPVKKSDDCGCD
jgi:HK97 family phage prohead protease